MPKFDGETRRGLYPFVWKRPRYSSIKDRILKPSHFSLAVGPGESLPLMWPSTDYLSWHWPTRAVGTNSGQTHRLERQKYYAVGPVANQANRAKSGLPKGFSPLRRVASLMRKICLAEVLKMRESRGNNSLKPEIGSVSAPSVWNSITTKMRCLNLKLPPKLQTRLVPNKHWS